MRNSAFHIFIKYCTSWGIQQNLAHQNWTLLAWDMNFWNIHSNLENKSENQNIYMLTVGVRWSAGPTRQRYQSRGGALASLISLAVRSPTTTVRPTCSPHQATSVGGEDVTYGSPEMAHRWQWRTTEVAQRYARRSSAITCSSEVCYGFAES